MALQEDVGSIDGGRSMGVLRQLLLLLTVLSSRLTASPSLLTEEAQAPEQSSPNSDCLRVRQKYDAIQKQVDADLAAAMALPARTGFEGTIDVKLRRLVESADVGRERLADLRAGHHECFNRTADPNECLRVRQKYEEIEQQVDANLAAAMALPARTGFECCGPGSGTIDVKRRRLRESGAVGRQRLADLRAGHQECFGSPSAPSIHPVAQGGATVEDRLGSSNSSAYGVRDGRAAAATTSGPKPGDLKRSNRDGLEYVWIPEGTFRMGCVEGDELCSDDEKPSHEVRLTNGYWMGRTAVTVGAFRKFLNATGYRTTAERDGGSFGFTSDGNGNWTFEWVKGLNWKEPLRVGEVAAEQWPAVQVSWEDAKAYCEWGGGRLPKEAEWERAARGGESGWRFPWGYETKPKAGERNAANMADESYNKKYRGIRFDKFKTTKHERDGFEEHYDDGYADLAPVASFVSNGYGLYDMVGNVQQWCADWYDDYGKSGVEGPRGSDGKRVLRGGAWGNSSWGMRLSCRGSKEPASGYNLVGIRCVRDRLP